MLPNCFSHKKWQQFFCKTNVVYILELTLVVCTTCKPKNISSHSLNFLAHSNNIGLKIKSFYRRLELLKLYAFQMILSKTKTGLKYQKQNPFAHMFKENSLRVFKIRNWL